MGGRRHLQLLPVSFSSSFVHCASLSPMTTMMMMYTDGQGQGQERGLAEQSAAGLGGFQKENTACTKQGRSMS